MNQKNIEDHGSSKIHLSTGFFYHTVVRTPNGGDYGADLLRQHHERYDHSGGHHRVRRD